MTTQTPSPELLLTDLQHQILELLGTGVDLPDACRIVTGRCDGDAGRVSISEELTRRILALAATGKIAHDSVSLAAADMATEFRRYLTGQGVTSATPTHPNLPALTLATTGSSGGSVAEVAATGSNVTVDTDASTRAITAAGALLTALAHVEADDREEARRVATIIHSLIHDPLTRLTT